MPAFLSSPQSLDHAHCSSLQPLPMTALGLLCAKLFRNTRILFHHALPHAVLSVPLPCVPFAPIPGFKM